MEETGVVLLATYPKTGSTWVKWLMAEIVSSGTPINDFMPSFGKTLPSAISFELSGKSSQFMKTHMSPDHPNIAKVQDRLEAVISIRRHPLDILLSSLNYAMVKNETSCFLRGEPKKVQRIVADGDMQHYIDRFIEDDGFAWYTNRTGPFSLFQRQWRMEAGNSRYLELCYEELVAAPHDAVSRLASFLGVSANDDKIDEVVSRAEAHTRNDGRFYWMRRAYNHEKLLPYELSSDFNMRYKSVLDELGYRS